MLLSNDTRSEAMYNVLVYQLARFYQTQWVPPTAWTASVMWYIRHKLARIKISQRFSTLSV